MATSTNKGSQLQNTFGAHLLAILKVENETS